MTEQPKSGQFSLGKLFAFAVLPMVVLGCFVGFLLAQDLRSAAGVEFPPVEEVVFERVVLEDHSGPEGHRIIAQIRNDGPDPVQIAQVMVDEAYWGFSMKPADGVLTKLQSGVISIPYHWVEGEAHAVTLLTSTGVTFGHVIEVAVPSPEPTGEFLGFFALMGVYVGVIPVAIGLLWFPVLARLRRRGLDFVLFLTVGLLVFLGIETFQEGLELAEVAASSFHPSVLFVVVALSTFLGLQVLSQRRGEDPMSLSYMVALGIGLHNLGEGLAIGAAYNAGELALGATLIVGFAIHNTTEGLAIVAPIAKQPLERGRLLKHLTLLGLIAGGPTVAGAWIGAFAQSALWGSAFMAIGVGAIFQVVVAITRQAVRKADSWAGVLNWNNFLGLTLGFAIMLGTGLMV